MTKLQRETENLQGSKYKKHLDYNWDEIEKALLGFQNQIATIVKPPDDSGISEVTDARVGQDGKAHSNLKIRLDAEMKGALDKFSEYLTAAEIEVIRVAIQSEIDSIDAHVLQTLTEKQTEIEKFVTEALANKQNVSNLSKGEILWTGGLVFDVVNSIKPLKKLSECENGWVLTWVKWDRPNDEPRDDTSLCRVVIRKSDGLSGRNMFTIALNQVYHSGNNITKHVLHTNDSLSGHGQNVLNLNDRAILTEVRSF